MPVDEEQRFHVYELKLLKDEACTQQITCDLPVSSGHFVNLHATTNGSLSDSASREFGPGSAFDGWKRKTLARRPAGIGRRILV